MNNFLDKIEYKEQLLGWYENYLRLFRLLRNKEDKLKLNENWKDIKKGLKKLYFEQEKQEMTMKDIEELAMKDDIKLEDLPF